MKNKIIHLLSGGLDSTVLLYDLKAMGDDVHCLLFNYGQTHIQELSCARKHCADTATPFTIVELQRIKGLFARSALTDGDGSKIVPNRNAVLLHIAAAIGESMGFDMVTIGCNKDDQRDFPDCSREFIESVNANLKAAQIRIEVCAPYTGMTKRQIVMRAKEFGWPYDETVSCYGGNDCGMCDACKLRKEAMA